MSTSANQILQSRKEVEASIIKARDLRDQWLAVRAGNPTNLTKKEIDYIGKAFKNRLLTVKWDCEDLEELVSLGERSGSDPELPDLEDTKRFIEQCRYEISNLMDQLEEPDSSNKIFNKHGISIASTIAPARTLMSPASPNSANYEKLTNDDLEEVRFDRGQLEAASSAATVFNNALYDHLERSSDTTDDSSRLHKGLSPSQIFSNISRPVTNVYMNPNDNEIILNMLETEYYNPPTGWQVESRLDGTLGKLFNFNRNKFLGTIAFLFSFPVVLLIMLFT